MVKDALKAVKTALSQVKGLRYVAEDWGQLDYFKQPPAKFPCALVDIEVIDYTDNAPRVQQAAGELTVRIADSRSFNGSFTAPPSENEFMLFDLLQEVYLALQNLSGPAFTPLSRLRTVRARRDDGLREFQMTFRFGFTDWDAVQRPRPKIG